MIDREKVLKQTEQAAQRVGRFRYLRKDSTTNLRILEYKDKDGDKLFAQQQVEHRRQAQGGKSIGICRMEMFGKPCAFCRANQMARDNGQDAPFSSRTRYIINALNIDDDPNTVRLWVVPTTVFNDVAEFTLDEEWADILEPKKGSAFSIKREGSGLDTTYATKPQRRAYPVGKAVLDQVVDPLTEVQDQTLERQCAEIGVGVDDLFTQNELEAMTKEEPKTTGKSGKKARRSSPETPPEPTMEVGAPVTYKDETEVCHISDIDGKVITIEDEKGKEYDVGEGDLTLVTTEAPGFKKGDRVQVMIDNDYYPGVITKIGDEKASITFDDGDKEVHGIAELEEIPKADDKKAKDSDAPKCFGDSNLYDADDDECQKCSYFEECGGNSELNKAGVGEVREPAETKGGRTADDIVSDIIGKSHG